MKLTPVSRRRWKLKFGTPATSWRTPRLTSSLLLQGNTSPPSATLQIEPVATSKQTSINWSQSLAFSISCQCKAVQIRLLCPNEHVERMASVISELVFNQWAKRALLLDLSSLCFSYLVCLHLEKLGNPLQVSIIVHQPNAPSSGCLMKCTQRNTRSSRAVCQGVMGVCACVCFRAVGTFARALDCSSSIRQPSLHMSAAAASRDITLVRAKPAHTHTHTLFANPAVQPAHRLFPCGTWGFNRDYWN